MLALSSATHHQWVESRNQTGYDTFTTVADSSSKAKSFLKSAPIDPRFKGDRKKWYDTGFLETSTGAAYMYEAVFLNYIEGKSHHF